MNEHLAALTILEQIFFALSTFGGSTIVISTPLQFLGGVEIGVRYELVLPERHISSDWEALCRK